ncbi:MAG: hypothetical protein AAB837_00645 [Patescibacteria group bacterium]
MFSIKESLKFGWEKFKANLEISLLTTLLMVAVGSLTGKEDMVLGWLFAFALVVFLIIIRIGYTKIFLRIHDGESPKFTEIFQEYKTFWRYLGVSILMSLAVLGGLILLIIPGIIWAVRFSFSPIIVVDTKLGPVASMKESYAITKGSFWHLFFFWIVLALVNLLGLILFGVGLLITVPLTVLATVYVYRELSKAKAGLMQTASPQQT